MFNCLKCVYCKLFLSLLLLSVLIPSVFALDLDFSIDDEIRKKYDTSKLEYEVPQKMPVADTNSISKPSQVKQTTVPTKSIAVSSYGGTKNTVIPAGMKLKVKSNQVISNNLSKNTIVSFSTTEDAYKSSTKVPRGTKVTGRIVNSHYPQITGNGGLIVIELIKINYQGTTYEIEGRVLKANNKKAFFNRIKGKHSYWANVGKRIDSAENFYNKLQKVSTKVSKVPIVGFVSFVPKLIGGIGYTGLLIVSPITGLTGKGQSISIPSGSNFVLKI